MSHTLLLVLMGLTTFRATWFVTRDSFPPMRRIREFLLFRSRVTGHEVKVDEQGHADPDGEYIDVRGGMAWAAELITCYWCVSVWLAAGVTVLVDLTVHLPVPLLWFGGTAAIAALTAYVTDRLGGD
jgi:hypothetical protein